MHLSLSLTVDGVDLSQSSLVQGHSRAPIAFPYHTRVGAETQEHWRLLEEADRVPFNLWNGSTIVAWVSTGLGERGAVIFMVCGSVGWVGEEAAYNGLWWQ